MQFFSRYLLTIALKKHNIFNKIFLHRDYHIFLWYQISYELCEYLIKKFEVPKALDLIILVIRFLDVLNNFCYLVEVVKWQDKLWKCLWCLPTHLSYTHTDNGLLKWHEYFFQYRYVHYAY